MKLFLKVGFLTTLFVVFATLSFVMNQYGYSATTTMLVLIVVSIIASALLLLAWKQSGNEDHYVALCQAISVVSTTIGVTWFSLGENFFGILAIFVAIAVAVIAANESISYDELDSNILWAITPVLAVAFSTFLILRGQSDWAYWILIVPMCAHFAIGFSWYEKHTRRELERNNPVPD